MKNSILVVDDTPSTISMLRTALEGDGHEVFVATNGEKALKRAELTTPDLILLDILMPVMDGYETCRQLKARRTTRDIPVIFMSALTDTFDKVRGFDLGAVDYITKPIETRELLSRVNTHLTIRRLQQELLAANTTLEEKVRARTEELRTANVQLHEEIFERTNAEESLRRINRAYKALSESNQVLIRALDEQELLRDVCRIIRDECGYHLVWVGLAGDDESRSVRPVAQAGYEEGYLDTVNIVWADTDRGRGPTGTAIRTGRPVVIRDVMKDPGYGPWRDEASHMGYASCAAFPLTANEKTLGALNVYAGQADAFDPTEVRLMMELAGDLAFGIMSLRLRQEHARAEEALRESEERYRQLVNDANDMIYRTDIAGHFVFCNPIAVRATGYSQEELLGMHYSHLVRPDCREDVERFYGRQFVERIPNTYYEFPVIAKDGKGGWVGQNVQLITKGDRVAGFQAVARDITDRVKAERAITRAKKDWERTFDAVPDLIAILDTNYRIVRVNRAMAARLGLTPAECVGQTCYEVVHGTDDPPSFCPHVPLLRDGREHTAEVPAPRLGGHFVVSTSPITGADGRLTGCVHVARDITDRKRAEESQRLLVTAVEQSADTIVIMDRDGIIQYVNPAFESSSGCSAQEAIGRKTRFFEREGYDTDFHRALLDTITRGEVWTGRLVSKRKDRSTYYEDATISPVRDPSGEIVNYVASKRDVTKEVGLETQLREAQKMESIATLASGIAHDFNNLLMIFSACAEVLLIGKNERSPGYKELKTVLEATRRGADLVRRILTFSRRLETDPRPINLNDEVEHAQKLLYRTIPKMIDIKLDLADDLQTANVDPGQLGQAVLNLAINARDAMPDGGRLVFKTSNVHLSEAFCKAHVGVRPGEYVLLQVSDSGCGMEKEVRERIFEPFFTTKERGEGTGLGLAMVHGIAKGHGGHIDCESEPGVGTTFSIYFPVMRGKEESDEADIQEALQSGTETILVVDDEEPIRRLTEGILTRAGYSVLFAENGAEAVERYTKDGALIALVLLDLIMPEMGGLQCLREILRIDPKAKVLIATGFSVQERTNEALEAGAKALLRKPFKSSEILRAVRQVLDET